MDLLDTYIVDEVTLFGNIVVWPDIAYRQGCLWGQVLAKYLLLAVCMRYMVYNTIVTRYKRLQCVLQCRAYLNAQRDEAQREHSETEFYPRNLEQPAHPLCRTHPSERTHGYSWLVVERRYGHLV